MSDNDNLLREFLRNSPITSELTEEALKNLSHVDRNFVANEYHEFMRDVVFKAQFMRENVRRSSYFMLFVLWSEEVGTQLYNIIAEEAVGNLQAWHNEHADTEDQNPSITPFLHRIRLKKEAQSE
jgi:hypothetical protein